MGDFIRPIFQSALRGRTSFFFIIHKGICNKKFYKVKNLQVWVVRRFFYQRTKNRPYRVNRQRSMHCKSLKLYRPVQIYSIIPYIVKCNLAVSLVCLSVLNAQLQSNIYIQQASLTRESFNLNPLTYGGGALYAPSFSLFFFCP